MFGGAFDPPHATHRQLASRVRAHLGVSELRVLPAGDHPHKRGASLTPAPHRLAMCEIAFAGLPQVRVDDREMRREGRCYSLDTIREFRSEMGADARLFWLIGSDNLPLLPSWHDHHALLAEATLVTYPRAGHPTTPSILDGLDLTDEEKRSLLVHCLDIPGDDVNATDIRSRIVRGEDCAHLLGIDVARYVEEHGLYR